MHPLDRRSRRPGRPARRATAAAGAIAALAVLGLPSRVSAHTVQPAGPDKLAIGWLQEPAYVGFENAVQVVVTGADGKPYTAFPASGSGLKVIVLFGKPGGGALPASPALDLEPSFDPDTGLGTPGETLAPIVPTAAGDYTFHITGSLGAQSVDLTVTSGDQTFDTVRGADAVEFPQRNPALSEIVAAAQRAQARADTAAASANQAAEAAQSAKDSSTHALVVGIVALVVGVLLGGGGLALALLSRRRRGRPETS